jgi:hypothetical protein
MPTSEHSNPTPARPTRRDFVKTSLLGSASAVVLGSEVARAAPPVPVTTAAATTSPALPPVPLVPFGSGQPLYLADLDRALPASAQAKSWQPHRWKQYPFETPQVKGVMLACGQNTGVPDLEYVLPQKGWYAISFGLQSHYWESRLQVRFKNDPIFSVLTPNNLAEAGMMWDDIQWSKHAYNSPGIEELFWRHAELGGKHSSLILRQLKVHALPGGEDAFGNIFSPCWLAYIKLVPLSEAEVAQIQADRRRTDTRRLFAADDAFSATALYRFRTADDVRRQIEPYRDTDFARMYWEAGAGDVTNYPSQVGRQNSQAWMAEHYRLCDRLRSASVQDFQRAGLDPFKIALEHSHAVGLEFHASYRVAGFHFPAPEDEWNAGGLYEKHPEWRSRDRLGRVAPRLSYAVLGVQAYVLSLHEEIVTNYPVDGISLLFNRRLPILGYDDPLVESFQAKHHLDPRTLPANDPRWLAHSAEVLTGFMRELRRRMQAAATRQGRKPIGITAVVMSSIEENYSYGLDLAAWVKEGLIDTLIPYSSVKGINSRVHAWEDPAAIAEFVRLTKDMPCKLAPNLMPRGLTPEQYKRRADGLYRAGVEHLFFWDCFGRTNFDPSWTTLTRLGHKDELADWSARGGPPVTRPRSDLTRIGDWDLTYQTPG